MGKTLLKTKYLEVNQYNFINKAITLYLNTFIFNFNIYLRKLILKKKLKAHVL